MKTIDLIATNNTPAVCFEENGKLLIKGRSIVEDALQFYQPLISWAKELQISSLAVSFDLEYMNSSSSKKLMTLMNTLDTNKNIKEITVYWFYEEGDEDSLEKGMVFEKSLHKAVFTYHKYSETG